MYNISEKTLERLRAEYPKGARVELWYDNIDPQIQRVEGNSEIKNLLNLMGKNRDKLSGTLTDKQKESLEKTATAARYAIVLLPVGLSVVIAVRFSAQRCGILTADTAAPFGNATLSLREIISAKLPISTRMISRRCL